MSQATDTESFVDRRSDAETTDRPNHERRQFADSRQQFSEDVRELAEAIDQYKVRHRRRFITYEEMHQVIASLGYHK